MIFHIFGCLQDEKIRSAAGQIRLAHSKVTKNASKSTEKALKSTEENNDSSRERYIIRIEEEILDAEQVAAILNSSKKVIERELREGKLTGYKRLNKWFVLKSDLVRYIREADGQ